MTSNCLEASLAMADSCIEHRRHLQYHMIIILNPVMFSVSKSRRNSRLDMRLRKSANEPCRRVWPSVSLPFHFNSLSQKYSSHHSLFSILQTPAVFLDRPKEEEEAHYMLATERPVHREELNRVELVVRSLLSADLYLGRGILDPVVHGRSGEPHDS